ncbi:MAG TPA: hypothetical protein VEK08_20620 [Planctomycetota bacterium]|nr:hypothetical protein [Planctomycetota bacterium]
MTTENGVQNGRVPLGKARVPVQFGEQVIVSILYNHDANPVHHRPDHAIQWMLGLLAAQGVGGTEGGLEKAGPAERTYTLGTKLLARQDVVVMPGIVLAAICFERFIAPEEITVSITTSFTYPLLVPTKGAVDVTVEAYEVPPTENQSGKLPGCRSIQIEAFGPGITNQQVRLLKMEATVFRADASPDAVYEKVVAPQFAELSKMVGKLPGFPALMHPSSISSEDRRRYSRIVEPGQQIHAKPITESAWQCKIPRVLTEVIEHLRHNDAYQKEVTSYYSARPEEAERREAIRRYVAKEIKYGWLKESDEAARVEALAETAQHLYARQHTVFDPRKFRKGGAATAPGAQMHLDLNLSDMKLRRSIHRFYTAGRLKDDPVFMGEATVMSAPLVTRDLANFLVEINHSFSTLKLFEYAH